MRTIHAVYENGLFRPTDPVELPDPCEVELNVQSLCEYSPLPVGAARSFRERGASAPCFPERGKASAPSAAETADSRPPLASDPKR